MSRTKTSPRTKVRSRPRRTGRLRWMIAIFAGITIIVGGLWGTVWWEEQPLARVEQLLTQQDAWPALTRVDQFLRTHPEHGRAIALKARALVQLRRAEEASRLFDQVGAASKEDMRACAQAYLMLERWVQALPVLEYLLIQDPADADLLHEVSACRAKLGQFDGAVEAASRFAAMAGNEAHGQMLIGMLESGRGNYRKACEAWSRVLLHDAQATKLQIPADEFFFEYGSVLLQAGEPRAAVEKLRQSLAIKSSAKTRSALGKACNQLGQEAEAENEWRNAVALDPKDETARQGLAELAMKRADFPKAIEWLQPLATSPSLTSESAFLLQRAYTLVGDPDSARSWQTNVEQLRKHEGLVRAVDQMLINSPSSKWGHVLQSYRLAEQGNWDQAAILLAPQVDGAADPFVRELAIAVQNHGTLPDLERLPLTSFQ